MICIYASHFCQVNSYYIKPSSKNCCPIHSLPRDQQPHWFYIQATLNKHHHHQKPPTSPSRVLLTTQHILRGSTELLPWMSPLRKVLFQQNLWLCTHAHLGPALRGTSTRNGTALDITGWTLGFFIQLIHTIQTLLCTPGIRTNKCSKIAN